MRVIARAQDRKDGLRSRLDEGRILRPLLRPHDWPALGPWRSCRAMHRHPPGGGGPRHDSGPLRLPLGPPRRPGSLLLLLITAAALALGAGCGGGSGGSTGTEASAAAATNGATSAAGTGEGTTLQLKADA